MKTKFYICLIILLSLSCSAYSSEWDYHYTRIPTDDISGFFCPGHPVINDQGNVAFVANSLGHIYFWENYNLTYLYDSHNFYFPEISLNNNNDIVYYDYQFAIHHPESDIFLNGEQLPGMSQDNSYNHSPCINNKGEIAWNHSSTIVLWDGEDYFSMGAFGTPQSFPVLNDNSQVLWRAYNENLYLWTNGVNTQITDIAGSGLTFSAFDMNINGEIVYSYYYTNELYLYNGITTTLIANNCSDTPFSVHINDSGEIVWESGGDESDIFVYKNGEVSQVTDDPFMNTSPDINNNGDIVYIQDIDNDRSIIVAAAIPEPSVVFLFFLGSLFLVRKSGKLHI